MSVRPVDTTTAGAYSTAIPLKSNGATITHPTTGDTKQIPGAWIQVNELSTKWIMNPPTKKGVHLSWTIGGVFCGSHFAKTM